MEEGSEGMRLSMPDLPALFADLVRLERNGLVARRPHPSDRRSSVIALTRAGATTHTKAQRLIAAELDAHIGGVLSDRELDQLHRATAKLRAALAAG
jgi:MarR family transcriptional regulator, multiple antibiotic resistance protein MarR